MYPHFSALVTVEPWSDSRETEDDPAFELPAVNAHGKRDLPQRSAKAGTKRQSLIAHSATRSLLCPICQKTTKNAYSLRRHVASKHGPRLIFSCDEYGCREAFTRNDTLLRHQRTQHGFGKVPCPRCGKAVRGDGLTEHLNTKACHQNRIDNKETRANSTSSTFAKDRGSQHGSKAAESLAICYLGDADLPSQSGPQTEWDQKVAHISALDTTFIITYQQKSMTFACGEPTLIPDSPRPLPVESVLDITMLDYDDEITDLVYEVEKRKSALSEARFLGATLMDFKTNLFDTSQPPRRFYRMDFGTRCALCEDQLGRIPESVFQHAKSHLRRQGQLDFKCPTCGVLFAYEVDLRLHSSELRLWSHCRGQSVELNDRNDWLAEAELSDDNLFVDLLRQWESLQLLWYLRAVRWLLTRPKTNDTTARFLKPRLHVECTSLKTLHTAPNLSIRAYDDHMGVESLTRMFSKTRLSAGGSEPFAQMSAPCSGDVKAPSSPDRIRDSSTRFWTSQLQQESSEDARATIASGANVNTLLDNGSRPLHVACSSWKSYEFVECLLSLGAKVDAKDADLNTPLMALIKQPTVHRNPIAVSEVFRRHASLAKGTISSEDVILQPKNPAYWKYWGCCPDLRRPYPERTDCIHLLLRHKASVDARNAEGMTALIIATIGGDAETVKILLNHGAQMETADFKGRDAYHWISLFAK